MKRRTQIALGVGVALVAVAVAAVVVVEDAFQSRSTPATPRQVPATFEDVRDSPGHVAHLATHRVECADCHEVRENGFTPPSPDVCTRCHEDRHPEIHLTPSAETPTCLGCHRFGADTSIAPDACLRCHAEPHGETWAVERHRTVACARCHRAHEAPSLAPATCTECHAIDLSHHATPPALAPAAASTLASTASPAACLECHRAHVEPDRIALACTECHADDVATSQALFHGHDACTNCHAPHGFAASAVRACTSCHRDTVTLASARVPAHRDCTSCHRPHDVRSASVASCRSCHAEASSTARSGARSSGAHAITSDHGAGGECIGCHAPHPSVAPSATLTAVRAGVADCTSCHAGVHPHAGDSRVHELSHAARVPDHRAARRVRALPPRRDRASSARGRSHRLHALPRERGALAERTTARVRDVSPGPERVGAVRAPRVRALSSRSRWGAPAGGPLRRMSCTRGGARSWSRRRSRYVAARGDAAGPRLRQLPPPARSGRPERAAHVRELPRAGLAAWAPSRRGSPDVLDVPLGPRGRAGCDPSDVHHRLPSGPARPRARRARVQRLPRVHERPLRPPEHGALHAPSGARDAPPVTVTSMISGARLGRGWARPVHSPGSCALLRTLSSRSRSSSRRGAKG